MHLKRIKIYGFKSFAQDVVLELKPGITALVGPNGGGKSNVVDAIRWALGEQRLRDLRAERWEDLLHQGGGLRNPARMAEVILEFDNQDGEMPLWPESLSVARRYYRSGDSEYIINGKTVRLKDITDLFLDSGLGRFSYAIISQGRVEGALLQKPHERLEQLQEAAGVSRYKVRKKETLSHLQDTEAKSVRLTDLLDEVARQMNEVRERAEIESRYRVLEDRRLVLQRRLDYTEYERAMAKKHRLHDDLAKLSEERKHLAQELAQVLDHIARTRQVIEQLGSHTEADLEELKSIQSETTQLQVREREMQTQIAHIDAETQRIEASLMLMRRHEEDLAAEREIPKNPHDEAPDGLRTRAEQLQNDLSEKAQRLKDLRDEDALLQRQRAELDHTRHDLEQRLERLKGILGIVDGHSEVMATMQQRDAERESLQSQVSEWVDRLSSLESERRREKERLAHLDRDLIDRRRNTASYEARLRALKQLEDEGEGLQAGVRSVLRAARNNQLTGILGTLGSLVESPPDLTLAIETALGGQSQDVVVTREELARTAVRYLQSSSLGRATFLPLDTVRASRPSDQDYESLTRQPGVLGWASDLIRFAADLRPAVMHTLGRVLIVESLDDATPLGRVHHFRYKMVTRDGQVVHAGGAITGGSSNPGRHSTAGRKQEMSRLTEQLESGIKGIEQLDGERAEVTIALERIEQQLEGGKEQLVTMRTQWEKLTRDLEVHQHMGDPKILVQSIAEKSQASHDLEVRIENIRAELQREQEVVEQLERDASFAKQKWQEKQQEWREQQLIHDRIAQEEGRVRQQVQSQSERLIQLAVEREQLVGALREVSTGLSRVALDEANREKVRADRMRQLTDQREQALKLDHRERALLSEDRKMENRENVWRQEILAISVRFEDYSPEQGLGAFDREEETAARSEMEEIAETLVGLGPLVPGSLAVYEQLAEREQYLAHESRDVEDARRELMGTLREIDEEMERRVKDTALRVEQAFQEACRQLYAGGDGGFSWVSGEEGGVELWVRPAGKRKSHLALLSGGEKALGGIAWLFSLLSARPSPFVVLDEVEASLDEANASRFAQYVRRVRAEAQYVIVTHHRETMEVADALWGIAGDGQGQSRVISVLLEGAEELVGS